MTDLTEHPTREGKLYCGAVIDAWSRRVVGWSIDRRPTAAMVDAALDMAVAARKPAVGSMVHSDHGAQGELNRSSSNGRLEGTNNKLQLLRRVAHGFVSRVTSKSAASSPAQLCDHRPHRVCGRLPMNARSLEKDESPRRSRAHRLAEEASLRGNLRSYDT